MKTTTPEHETPVHDDASPAKARDNAPLPPTHLANTRDAAGVSGRDVVAFVEGQGANPVQLKEADPISDETAAEVRGILNPPTPHEPTPTDELDAAQLAQALRIPLVVAMRPKVNSANLALAEPPELDFGVIRDRIAHMAEAKVNAAYGGLATASGDVDSHGSEEPAHEHEHSLNNIATSTFDASWTNGVIYYFLTDPDDGVADKLTELGLDLSDPSHDAFIKDNLIAACVAQDPRLVEMATTILQAQRGFEGDNGEVYISTRIEGPLREGATGDQARYRAYAARFQTLVHEYCHALEHPAFHAAAERQSGFGKKALVEGGCEYFTRAITDATPASEYNTMLTELFGPDASLPDNLIPPRGSYPNQLQTVQTIVGKVGHDNFARAFFQGDVAAMGLSEG